MAATLFGDLLGRTDRIYSAQVAVQGESAASNANLKERVVRSSLKSVEAVWQNPTYASTKTTAQKTELFGEQAFNFYALPTDRPAVVDSSRYLETPIDRAEVAEESKKVQLEAERAFFNQAVLSSREPRSTLNLTMRSARKGFEESAPTPSVVSEAHVSRRELLFGAALREFLDSKRKKDLVTLFMNAVKSADDDSLLGSVWAEATALCREPEGPKRDPKQLDYVRFILDRATDFLHHNYVEHLQTIVEKNTERALRGGVPGRLALVQAYLNVTGTVGECEEGEWTSPEGLAFPVWAVAYHVFRAGDLAAAKKVLSTLKHHPHCAILVTSLNSLTDSYRLDVELRVKLMAEWRHEASSSRDVYKRGLYSVLLAQDCPQLAQSIEDWLWFRLASARVNPNLTPELFMDLQKNISINFGEEYFMADGSPFHYYFTALWLSGQWERAVALLADKGAVVDAVHVAILAKTRSLLKVARADQPLLAVDETRPTDCGLNYAKLLSSYLKSFELTDVPRALDYISLLRGIESPAGGDLFETALSRLLFLTQQHALILGERGVDGVRSRGLLDSFLCAEEVERVIVRLAEDADLEGERHVAIELFLLANASDKAVELATDELSDALKSRADWADTAKRAEEIVERASHASASQLQALCLLLDISTFLKLCASGRNAQALSVIRKLRLIPADADSSDASLSSFHLLPQKVREVLPEVCLALMKLCVAEVQHGGDRTTFMKQAAAIILFSAVVPYKFPLHINSQLLALQAQIS